MGEPIEVSGIVLSVMPIGEYDKRVVLLTKERGRVTAFARGARRQTSALLAACNPFVFGTFTLYEGRNSYTLVAASVQYAFRELASALPEVYYGFYFLEFADYYGTEYIDESQMINLLYMSLKALLSNLYDNELVCSIFVLRAMVINGEYAVDKDADISESALYALEYASLAPLQKLYSFSLTPEVFVEFRRTIEQHRKKYIDHHFKSLDILETQIDRQSI